MSLDSTTLHLINANVKLNLDEVLTQKKGRRMGERVLRALFSMPTKRNNKTISYTRNTHGAKCGDIDRLPFWFCVSALFVLAL